MKCKSHYPIMGRWDVIEETRDHKTWKCPKCGETYTSRIHKGKIWKVPQRIKDDFAKNWKNTLQPRRSGKPSKEFIEHYPEQAKEIFTEKEMKSAKNTWFDQPGAKSSKD